MNESPELKQKAEEVCKNVKQIMEENAIDGPFVAEPGVGIKHGDDAQGQDE